MIPLLKKKNDIDKHRKILTNTDHAKINMEAIVLYECMSIHTYI